jgi:hypothetical protein
MKNLVSHFGRLSRAKRVAISALVILIGLTWLSVCLVLASYWAK